MSFYTKQGGGGFVSGLGDPTTSRGSSYRSPTRFDYAVPYN